MFARVLDMTVVLVDCHPVFRVGVCQLLSHTPGYRVVGEAGTARDALDAVEGLAPDVVLMGIALPETDGIRATREIRRRDPKARVLILSASDQINDVFDALDAGAAGYALKTDPPEALIEALRTVGRGQRYLARALADRMAVFERRRQRGNDLLEILSTRERQVFGMASACMIARDMARELRIARKTVDTHLNRINHKLGLRNTAELIRLAASLGVLHAVGGALLDQGRRKPTGDKFCGPFPNT